MTDKMNISTGSYTEQVPSFLKKPEPIRDVAEAIEFDLVVVGAGSSGVPAALAAAEAGARVAVVQKEN